MSADLFTEFKSVDLAEWEAKATVDLKGKSPYDFSQSTADGLIIKPYYNAENSSLPLDYSARKETHWSVVEGLYVSDEKDSNAKALTLLNQGVNGLLFYVEESVDLEVLLKGIQIEYIGLHWVTEHKRSLTQKWTEYTQKHNTKALYGSINSDPLENILRTGHWFSEPSIDLEPPTHELAGLTPLAINANIYHNSGASTVQELAATLLHLNEYAEAWGNQLPSQAWINVAIGSDYFIEIAKLRALRVLLDHWNDSRNLSVKPIIYAESGITNKTLYDPWVNLLRTTSEGMSAVIGGANEVCLHPYDQRFKHANDFSLRIARNQQLLMMSESYLSKHADPGKGAFYIEELTSKLAKKAWKLFVSWESKGGWLQMVSAGELQGEISASAEILQKAFDSGERELLGTNLYPNTHETMGDKIEISSVGRRTPKGEFEPLQLLHLSLDSDRERLKKEKTHG